MTKFKLFIEDVLFELIQESIQLKGIINNEEANKFDVGQLTAYFGIINKLKSKAQSFNILNDFERLNDFEPESLLN